MSHNILCHVITDAIITMPLGPRPFEIARENVEHDAISVTDDEIRDAMRLTAEQLKQARYLSRAHLGHISGISRRLRRV